MKYGLYPGCSLERNSYAYLKSSRAIAPLLDIEFMELEDWNCCGATEYISLDLIPAYALIGRNLAIAEKQADTQNLVAPCSACYLNLRKTDHHMAESEDLAEKVNTALEAGGLHYDPGSVQVRHLLDVVVNDVGLETLKEKVTRPLAGMKVAPYYGCFVLRPEYAALDDPEYPTILDNLLRTLGAEVVDYPLKGQCCGGHMTQISEGTAMGMIRYLIKDAVDRGADAIVTVCPMCQLNLDAFQGDMNRYFKTDYHIPVMYFTQMIGLALGLSPREVALEQGLVTAMPALSKVEGLLESFESERSMPEMLVEAGKLSAEAGFWRVVASVGKFVGGGKSPAQNEEEVANE
ncbi:MAG: CoB--CoM heterodisulfide reductase iron-sulfur subunit B family protein [Anaerolineae bacterium]|nr:CoB--CoM heterodisulfide reductase iron-sulfur subunit B family protein [Anaerolineae bacterium]